MKRENIIEKEKAITLIALIITIVILIILAGIAVATITGENGLFARAKQAKRDYSISSAKEKLQLAISDLMIEQTSKGENLTKDNLPKINSDEIDVKSIEKFPIEVICQNYKFNVDENFVVTYVGEANETIITYTTEPNGYTNKDKVKILIKISNPKGIKSIQKPGETDRILPINQTEVGIDYEVTANGTYTFKIIDNENKETIKDIVIEQIDKEAPKDFMPSVKDIMVGNFTIIANVEDEDSTEISCKSGIEKYEYYIKEKNSSIYNKYESVEKEYIVEGLSGGKEYNVYIIAYDKAGNNTTSSIINVTTYTTPLAPTAKISFNEENATEKTLAYPILTLDGVKNCILEPNIGENIVLEIQNKKVNNMKYYYSIDGGNNWSEYIGKVNIKYQADNLIQVKSSYISDDAEIYSSNSTVKKYLYDNTKECTASDKLLKEAYDNDYSTYTDCDTDNSYLNKLLIAPECIGKYITVYTCTPNGSGYGCMCFFTSQNIKDIIKNDYLYRLSGDKNFGKKTAKSVKIPDNTVMIDLYDGTFMNVPFYVYEVKCTDENLTGTEF